MQPAPSSFFRDENGQVFAGYIVGLMLVAVVLVSVMNLVRRDRANTDARVYQQQAVEVARQGFEQGLSYFRRQPGGVYIASGLEKPVDQYWVTPWPIYPDAAFVPQAADTDHYNLISFPANVCMTCTAGLILAQKAGAGGIVHTFPLFTVASTGTAEIKTSPVWARYVIRRQNIRNWSPGPNTFSAFTDPDAVHDLTHLRGQSAPGSGNYWSMVSRSYIFTNPLGVTTAAGFEVPAMQEGGNMLSAPVRFYNKKRFLLATAKVYGELYRINFTDQSSAAWVNSGVTVTAFTQGIINGGSTGKGVATSDALAPINAGGFIGGIQASANVNQAPTIANVFPGLSKSKLLALSDRHGDINIFPTADQANLSDIASTTTFYYVTGTATFLPGNSTRVMTGVGLVFIDGDCIFKAGNQSQWSGIVYVAGNCVVHGPVDISGALIVAGCLTVGQTGGVNDINKGTVEYNPDSVAEVKNYLQRFKVDKNSILATFN